MESGQHKGSDIARMIWTIGSPTIFTLGVLGNLMTIIVLTNRKCKKTSSTIFITVLAVADLLLMTVVVPRWWFIYMFRLDIRHLHTVVCKLSWFISYWAGGVSTSILASVTVERTISTIKPYKVKTMCTVNMAIVISTTIAFIHLFIHGHMLLGMKLFEVTVNKTSNEIIHSVQSTQEVNLSYSFGDIWPLEMMNATRQLGSTLASFELDNKTCEFFNMSEIEDIVEKQIVEEESERKPVIERTKRCWYDDPHYGHYFSGPYQIISTVCYNVIPETIFFIGGILIVKKLQFSRKLRKRMMTKHMRDSGYKPTHDNQATQITMTLLLVNVVFVVSTLPVYVFLIGRSYWVDKETGMTETQEIVWAVTNQLYFINHACNFILYFLTGSRFRQQVLDTFRWKKSISRSAGYFGSQLTSVDASSFHDSLYK